jgi:hypothetical protein
MHNKPTQPNGLVRGLFTMIAAVTVGLGVLAMVAEVHSGSTRMKGLVTLEGDTAVAMGGLMVALGLMPLAIWAKTALQAKVWVGLCLAAFALLLLRALRG